MVALELDGLVIAADTTNALLLLLNNPLFTYLPTTPPTPPHPPPLDEANIMKA